MNSYNDQCAPPTIKTLVDTGFSCIVFTEKKIDAFHKRHNSNVDDGDNNRSFDTRYPPLPPPRSNSSSEISRQSNLEMSRSVFQFSIVSTKWETSFICFSNRVCVWTHSCIHTSYLPFVKITSYGIIKKWWKMNGFPIWSVWNYGLRFEWNKINENFMSVCFISTLEASNNDGLHIR